MKKLFLLLTSVVLATATFAQVLQIPASSPTLAVSNQGQISAPSLKNGGDIIWQATFNWENPADPRGWTLPSGWEIKDNMDLGNTWTWMKDSIKGHWTDEKTPSFFVSKTDGFICVPMDAYNYRDGISTDNKSDTYIITPPINCTQASSVVVELNQLFRLCCEGDNTGLLQLLVTNDDGSHWAAYDIGYSTKGNTFTPVKYRSLQINVSDVAAGMPNVRLKIYFHGSAGYFWAVDDLKLTEAYQNDLVLEDAWSKVNFGFADPIGHTNYLPFSQIGMDSPEGGKVGDYSFKGAMLNSGVADAEDAKINVQVLKNGTDLFNTNSPGATIWTLERDTVETNELFSPTDYGDYRFNINAVASNGEDLPANNTTNFSFTVNDTLFQRSDMSSEAGIGTGVWAGGNKAGDIMAVRYDIQVPTEINSITAQINSFTASQNPTFQFVLLKYMSDEDAYNELITSDVVDADSSLLGRATLPLVKDGETEFLEPGTYYAAFRSWAENGSEGMTLGWDMNDRAEFNGYNKIWLVGDGKWYSSDKLPIIGLNLNTKGGPTQAPVTFNVNMTKHIASGEFKPGTDAVDVIGLAPTWNGTASMTDADGDGIYTATVEGLPVAKVLNFKYRVNGTPEAYPLTGDPYRKYTVRYWNVLNSTFNGGVTAGVDPTSMVASFNVYPNPTSGAFSVAFTNMIAADLVITLTNIQGQIIYQNKVANVVNYQQTIDNKLSKGLYFLTVNTGKEVKVQKVVVQ